MPLGFTVTVAHGGVGKLPGTRLRPEILRLYMGVELRNWPTPTLVLAFYQHGFAIHQFFHPPFPEEEKETTLSCPAYWFVGPTICSPKEGNVRVPHSYACSWVRTPVLVLCHLITDM